MINKELKNGYQEINTIILGELEMLIVSHIAFGDYS